MIKNNNGLLQKKSTRNFPMSLLRRFATRALPASRNWRTEGHPAPLSLLDDHPEPPDLTEALPTPTPISTTTRKPKPPPRRPTPASHTAHRASLRQQFPAGWSPPRKLSREAMDGLRFLHRIDPSAFSTPVLADRFRISPEAVRRILKSKWAPSREEQARFARRERQWKEEAITKNLLEEQMRAMEIEKEADKRTRRERGRRGVVVGVDAHDTLTFQ